MEGGICSVAVASVVKAPVAAASWSASVVISLRLLLLLLLSDLAVTATGDCRQA